MIIIASHGLPSVAVVIGRLCDTMAIILSRCGRLLEFFWFVRSHNYIFIFVPLQLSTQVDVLSLNQFFFFQTTSYEEQNSHNFFFQGTVVDHYQATTSNIFLKYKNQPNIRTQSTNPTLIMLIQNTSKKLTKNMYKKTPSQRLLCSNRRAHMFKPQNIYS